MCCSRLALMRFIPFSYFYTERLGEMGWLIFSIIRRIRTRLPTWPSTAVLTFLAAAVLIPHLARAKWMTTHGHRHLLRGGTGTERRAYLRRG
jgi:hypothetical protein